MMGHNKIEHSDNEFSIIYHWHHAIFYVWGKINGLVQDCSNSIPNAVELPQSYTKPSEWDLFTIVYTEQETLAYGAIYRQWWHEDEEWIWTLIREMMGHNKIEHSDNEFEVKRSHTTCDG